MLLYTLFQQKLNSWSLEPDVSYRISNNIFDNDIYCEEINNEFSVRVLANSSCEFSFSASPAQLSLATISDLAIAGNFCTLNDCWFNCLTTTFIFASHELDLARENLPATAAAYRQNLNYSTLQPAAANLEDNLPGSSAELAAAPATASDAGAVADELAAAQNGLNDAASLQLEGLLRADNHSATSELIDEIAAPAAAAAEAEDFNQRSAKILAAANGAKKKAKPAKPTTLKGKLQAYGARLRESEFVAEFKKLTPYYLKVKQWARKHMLLASLIVILLIILIIITLIVNLTLNISHESTLSAESHYYKHSLNNDKKVKDIFHNLPVRNLNIYKEYDRYIITGMLMESRQVASVTAKAQESLKDMPISLNLVGFDQLQANILKIESNFGLNCEFARTFIFVRCTGTVIDKDSVKEQAFAEYDYNNIVPLEFNLLYKTDIEALVNQLLADKSMYRNVRYELEDNHLTLFGYIEEGKLRGLNNIFLLFLQKMPFIQFSNDLKIIEKEINLRIKQVVFNDYGNSLVDGDGSIYNVGSNFKNFTITSVEKNSITLRQNNNVIILATPFNTDNNPETDDKKGSDLPGAVKNSLSQNVGQLLSNAEIVPAISAMNNIAPAAVGIADINEQALILQEIKKARANNTNPQLTRAYDDLILNFNSDIRTQQRVINAASPKQKVKP